MRLQALRNSGVRFVHRLSANPRADGSRSNLGFGLPSGAPAIVWREGRTEKSSATI